MDRFMYVLRRMRINGVPLEVQRIWRSLQTWFDENLHNFPLRNFAAISLPVVLLLIALLFGYFGFAHGLDSWRLFMPPHPTPTLTPTMTPKPPPTPTSTPTPTLTPTPTPTKTPTPTLTPTPPPTTTPTSTAITRWRWCRGCISLADVFLDGKKIGVSPYFTSGATIVAPVSGKVTRVEIIEYRFEIRVRDSEEQISVLRYAIVDLEVNNNKNGPTLYEIDALSTDPADIVVVEGDWVDIGDPLMHIPKGKGVSGCFVYRENDWIPCYEGDR